MKVNQVYDILNEATKEILGEDVIVKEDLSNVVDIGKQFENLENGYDNYVRKIHDTIGRIVFVNRVKSSRVPSVIRDGWEYGAILEKIRVSMPEARVNESWRLENNASYDPNVFYAPDISVKFYNKRVTFEIAMSFTELQIKSAFNNATQLNALYSAIETAILNAMTKNLDELVKRTMNNFIAETIYSEYPGGVGTYGASSGVRAVNLLYLYNTQYGESLTAANALSDPDFIRFASYKMGLTLDRMSEWSVLFNVGGTEKFTPADRRRFVLLSEFKRAAGAYLYDATGQFNTDDILLPESETVTCWQGTGTDYGFGSTSKIHVTTADGHDVEISGVLGFAFDEDALGVCNENRRVKTDINNVAEFWTERHKFDAGYWNDFNENGVVFFVA